MSLISRSLLSKGLDLSLYLVADRKSVPCEELFFLKIARLLPFITCLQLRDQDSDFESALKTARRLKGILAERGLPLMINNRIDVAHKVGAEGVYLERTDLSYLEVRRCLGEEAVIGMPVHSLEDVQRAELTDVDYVSAKVFLSKRTNPSAKQVWGIEGLREVRMSTSHRIVAIGGIDVGNVEQVCSALYPGDGIAMVGDLWREEDPTLSAQKIRDVVQRSL